MPPPESAIAAAPRPAMAPPPPATPIQLALRRAARSGAGQAALRVRLAGGGVGAALRLVRQLMEEAGRGQGVFATGPAEWLLPEATAAAAAEARRAIETLLAEGPAPEITEWRLPDDGAALLSLAEEVAALPPAPPPPTPSARGLDALADGIPLHAILRRSPVLMLGAPGQLLPGPIRLGLRHDALGAALGPAGTDRDLLRHARDRIARRVLAALAEEHARRTLLGAAAPRSLVLELPADAMPLSGETAEAVAGAHGLPLMLAALPLSLAAEPGLMARRRAALAAHGWGLALRGVTASALAMLSVDALAADALLLRWSPALAGRAPAAALRRLDPACMILLGCDDEEALRWGLSMGIRHYGGAHPELILAAARMGACADRAQCTRRQCLLRAAAVSEDGREGCTNRPLLAAGLAGAEGG